MQVDIQDSRCIYDPIERRFALRDVPMTPETTFQPQHGGKQMFVAKYSQGTLKKYHFDQENEVILLKLLTPDKFEACQIYNDNKDFCRYSHYPSGTYAEPGTEVGGEDKRRISGLVLTVRDKPLNESDSPAPFMKLFFSSDLRHFVAMVIGHSRYFVYHPDGTFGFPQVLIDINSLRDFLPQDKKKNPFCVVGQHVTHGNKGESSKTCLEDLFSFVPSQRTLYRRVADKGFEQIMREFPFNYELEVQEPSEDNQAFAIPILCIDDQEQEHLMHIKSLTVTFPGLDEWIEQGEFLETDASWKAVPGYTYIDLHVGNKNRTLICGLTICPSESSEYYRRTFTQVRSHTTEQGKKALNNMPVLADMGSAIRKAFCGDMCNEDEHHKYFICHAHIIRNAGGTILEIEFVRRLLDESVNEATLEREKNRITVEMQSILADNSFTLTDDYLYMMLNDNPLPNHPYFTPESWKLCERMKYHVPSCTNHSESYHHHAYDCFASMSTESTVNGLYSIIKTAVVHWENLFNEKVPQTIRAAIKTVKSSTAPQYDCECHDAEFNLALYGVPIPCIHHQELIPDDISADSLLQSFPAIGSLVPVPAVLRYNIKPSVHAAVTTEPKALGKSNPAKQSKDINVDNPDESRCAAFILRNVKCKTGFACPLLQRIERLARYATSSKLAFKEILSILLNELPMQYLEVANPMQIPIVLRELDENAQNQIIRDMTWFAYHYKEVSGGMAEARKAIDEFQKNVRMLQSSRQRHDVVIAVGEFLNYGYWKMRQEEEESKPPDSPQRQEPQTKQRNPACQTLQTYSITTVKSAKKKHLRMVKL